MLCEAVVAVYVSLLIHALATDSSTELFRLAAHPLNGRMWAAVFGGGVKLVVKPRKPPESIPGTFLSNYLSDVSVYAGCLSDELVVGFSSLYL